MTRLIFTALIMAFTAACHPLTQKEKARQEINTGMVEITTFKLNQGVPIQDFEQLALSMQKEFLEKQPGFVRRTLAMSPDSM